MSSRSAWTAERLHALGPTTDPDRRRGSPRHLALRRVQLARRGAFPVPLRVGAIYRVPTSPLLTALHLDSE
jgi:hypothetical protein